MAQTGQQDTAAGGLAGGVTVDRDELAFFQELADTWWDPTGPFKPLHQLNPTRLEYIQDSIAAHFGLDMPAHSAPFAGRTLLDIGCGGGLISEPMAALGARVTAIDAVERNIKTASLHAAESGLEIDFRHMTADALADTGARFDIIINMEVVEHVADVSAYLKACEQLLAPGGIMLLSTLNRTLKSYIFAIVGAEYVLRWLPKGTHDWNKFITPRELASLVRHAGLKAGPATGYIFNPVRQRWGLSARDTSVNYAMTAFKAG